MTSSSASPDILPLIHAYYASKPDFSTFFDREREPQPTIEEQLKKLGLDEEQQKDPFLQTYFGKRKKMPVHPAEENATGSITDQVAKESKDSNASTHEHHQVDTGASSGGLGAEQARAAHKSPGPVSTQDIGEPASKEELKKRAEELNK